MARGPAPSESLWLPPRDAQLIDPYKEKIPTPVDEYGFVKIGQLIDEVRTSVDPSYEWRQDIHADIHHFYWPEINYPYTKMKDLANPRKFRELSVNKALVSREFHNWLHAVTIPPEPPSAEAMREQTEAYITTKNLYIASRLMVNTERQERRRIKKIENDPDTLAERFDGIDVYGNEFFDWQREKRRRAINLNMGKLATIPDPYRLTEIETDDTHAIARTLGRVIAPEFLILKRRAVA